MESGPQNRCFLFAEIQSATNNFSDELLLGSGGFGEVYRGSLDDGATAVAIKRSKKKSNQGDKEFWREFEVLSQLRHPNLVHLIGYCNEQSEMILVFEFMAGGTLADNLYRKSDQRVARHLTWLERIDACLDAAVGLDYLHTGTTRTFIHRDVKSTNILLDENGVAKVSDFGLSKRNSASTSRSTQTHSTSLTRVTCTEVMGTRGYLDYDYYLTGKVTKKSDVYAFGVVMLEVLCGRPPLDRDLDGNGVNLVLWVQQNIKNRSLDQVIDPSLRNQISPDSLRYFMEAANDCLVAIPKDRPTMEQVARKLRLAWTSQLDPQIPIGKVLLEGVIDYFVEIFRPGSRFTVIENLTEEEVEIKILVGTGHGEQGPYQLIRKVGPGRSENVDNTDFKFDHKDRNYRMGSRFTYLEIHAAGDSTCKLLDAAGRLDKYAKLICDRNDKGKLTVRPIKARSTCCSFRGLICPPGNSCFQVQEAAAP